MRNIRILIYGHGDVVQGDEKLGMGLNPWKLTKIGNRLYGSAQQIIKVNIPSILLRLNMS